MPASLAEWIRWIVTAAVLPLLVWIVDIRQEITKHEEVLARVTRDLADTSSRLEAAHNKQAEALQKLEDEVHQQDLAFTELSGTVKHLKENVDELVKNLRRRQR